MPNQNQELAAGGEPTEFTEPLLSIPQEDKDEGIPIDDTPGVRAVYPRHENDESLVGGHEVEPLAGMTTVEGMVTVRQWAGPNRESQEDRHEYRVRVRMATGPLTPTGEALNTALNNKQGRLADNDMGYIFEQIIGSVTNGNVYGEAGSSEPGAMAINLLIETAQANPNTPITLVEAHGGLESGEHHMITGGRTVATSLSALVKEIKSRDAYAQGGPVIVLASCNEAGIALQHPEATIVYRTGLAGGIGKTGDVCISRPPDPEDADMPVYSSIVPD